MPVSSAREKCELVIPRELGMRSTRSFSLPGILHWGGWRTCISRKKKVPSQYKVVDKIPHNADQHAEMASVDAKGNVYNPNSFHSALLMLMVLPSKRRTGLSYNFGWRRKKCSLMHVFLQPVSHKVGCISLFISTKILALNRLGIRGHIIVGIGILFGCFLRSIFR